MKKVVFISYYFPPMGGAGVKKSLKFVKYLQEYNYMPIVLTVDAKFTRWLKDKTLCKEIPANVQVYRTITIDLNWIYKILWGFRLHGLVKWIQFNLFIPDSEITWIPFAKMIINNILKTHQIELVYISGGPFSSMMLGPFIQRKFGVKFVVDFRDEWTNNITRLDWQFPRRRVLIERRMEENVLLNASGIVYTHPKYMKENFEDKYPFLKNKKNAIIPNGYDDEDFRGLTSVLHNDQKMLHFVYTGAFYDRRQPDILWNALSFLIRDGEIDPAQIKFEIIGKNKKSFVLGSYESDNNIINMVDFTPNKDYYSALESLLCSSVLFFFIAPGPNSNAELPGKLYDYLRTYKPIFAVVPPQGAAADIIRSCRSGFIYDSSDLNDVKKGLVEMYKLWKNDKLTIDPDFNEISKYNRKVQASYLANLFDDITI